MLHRVTALRKPETLARTSGPYSRIQALSPGDVYDGGLDGRPPRVDGHVDGHVCTCSWSRQNMDGVYRGSRGAERRGAGVRGRHLHSQSSSKSSTLPDGLMMSVATRAISTARAVSASSPADARHTDLRRGP